MASTTQQATAVAVAQNMLRLAPLLQSARVAIVAQNTEYADVSPDDIWPHLPTFAWADDGTVGTADNTPSAEHPISTSGLNRSSTQLTALAQVFIDFQTFLEGGALEAITEGNPSRNTIIDQAVG